MEDAPQELHNARIHFVFFQVHTISGIISSNQTGRFPITSNQGHAYVVVFYIFKATTLDRSPSKTGQRKNSPARATKHTNGLYCKGSNPNSTNWTMKRPTKWKHLSAHNTLTSSIHHQTFIAPTQRNRPYELGRIISYQGSQGYPSPSPSPTGVHSPPNATPP